MEHLEGDDDCDIDACDTTLGVPPLIVACFGGHLDIVQLLCNHGCDVNQPMRPPNIEGVTDTMRFLGLPVKITRYLDKLAARHAHHIISGLNPLISAAVTDQRGILQILLNRSADVKHVNNLGRTPLHGAAISSKGSCIAMLIRAGADMNATDATGMTPMLRALEMSRERNVQQLILHGCDIDARTPDGFHALHLAAMKDMPQVARLLVEQNADPNVVDSMGNAPYPWAIANDCMQTANLLLTINSEHTGHPVFNPGFVTIVKNTLIRMSSSMDSAISGQLEIGDRIMIQEILVTDDRVRGRLQNGGWMTLYHKTNRKTYVERCLTEYEVKNEWDA